MEGCSCAEFCVCVCVSIHSLQATVLKLENCLYLTPNTFIYMRRPLLVLVYISQDYGGSTSANFIFSSIFNIKFSCSLCAGLK